MKNHRILKRMMAVMLTVFFIVSAFPLTVFAAGNGTLEIKIATSDSSPEEWSYKITDDSSFELLGSTANQIASEMLPPGTYYVEVSDSEKHYMESGQKHTVTITEGGMTPLNISLTRKTIRINAMVSLDCATKGYGDVPLDQSTVNITHDGSVIATLPYIGSKSGQAHQSNYEGYIGTINGDITISIIPPSGFEIPSQTYTYTLNAKTQSVAMNETGHGCLISTYNTHGYIRAGSLINSAYDTTAKFRVYLKSKGSYAAASDALRERLIISCTSGLQHSLALAGGTYVVEQYEGIAPHMSPVEITIDTQGVVHDVINDPASIPSCKPLIYEVDDFTDSKIRVPGSYKIKDTAKDVYIKNGTEDTFSPDVNTELGFKLPAGSYELEIVDTPDNFYRADLSPIPFTIGGETTKRITVSYTAQRADVDFTSTIKAFSSVNITGDTYTPVFSQTPETAGAVILAREDIVYNGELQVYAGDEVDTFATHPTGNGQSILLYPGEYTLRPIVGEDQDFTVSFTDSSVLTKTIYLSQSLGLADVKIHLEKQMEEDILFGITGDLQGVSFGLYAAELLTALDGPKYQRVALLSICAPLRRWVLLRVYRVSQTDSIT